MYSHTFVRNLCAFIYLYASIFVVTLLIVNSATAISYGFGGTDGSSVAATSSTCSLSLTDRNQETSTLKFESGVALERAGHVTMALPSTLSEFNSVSDTTGSYNAATYGYISSAGSISYKWGGYATKSSAVCYEQISTTGAQDPFFGGYAYNTRGDYAAAQLRGGILEDGVDASLYYNNMFTATKSTSTASQRVSQAKGDFSLMSWAENGDLENEVLSEYDLLIPDEYPFGPATVNTLNQYSASYARFMDSDISVYSSTAQSGSSGATTSQSVSGVKADTAQMWSDAQSGAYNGDGPNVQVSVTGDMWGSFSYSGSAYKNGQSGGATQKLKVYSADEIKKGSLACNGYYTAQSNGEVSVSPEIDDYWQDPTRASATLSDTVKVTRYSVDLKDAISASGSDISRGISADNGDGLSVDANTFIVSSMDTINLLSGNSGVAVSSKGVSLSGSWSGSMAPDAYGMRDAHAENVIKSADLQQPLPQRFRFKEGALSTLKTVNVA